MKKTMFITSVIMVVVMAIALTTSSLAWFTAAGASDVTTAAFKVQAKSEAVQGIAISKTGTSNWGSEIALTKLGSTEGVAEDMLPLVPFAKDSTLANSVTASENEETLLTALLGGSENTYAEGTNENLGTTSDSTARSAFFIGNKLANNGLFGTTANVVRSGYYEDTFYLMNTGAGDGAYSTKVSCDITFWFNDGTLKEYTSANRGSAKYGLDANLCVAVLIQTNKCDDTAANEEWELLAFSRSQGTATNVAVGRGAAEFSEGELAANSCVTLTLPSNLTNGTKNSTDALRPQRNIASVDTAADVIDVRVIAWYEGATLTNVNAADADLMFKLSFSKHDVIPAP